jgi:hypothetical protein
MPVRAARRPIQPGDMEDVSGACQPAHQHYPIAFDEEADFVLLSEHTPGGAVLRL